MQLEFRRTLAPQAHRTRKITVVSDLHLFAARSRAKSYHDDILAAAQKSDLLVLNGDIFDFHWSTLGSFDRTLAAATEWLESLATTCEQEGCDLTYILGNHDGILPWAERCDELTAKNRNLHCSPDYYRLGDVLFTHGDLLLRPFPLRSRPLVPLVRCRSRFEGQLYGFASEFGIPRLVSLAYNKQRCAQIVSTSLKALDENLWRGVRRLCIGHTHRPFSDAHIGDLTIHNSGAAVQGIRFEPIMLTNHSVAARSRCKRSSTKTLL